MYTHRQKDSHRDTLDGLTILRFAHAFESGESGGGIERYLEDTDMALLARNRLAVVRMQLAEKLGEERKEEKIGQGTLIRVPLDVEESSRQILIDARMTREKRRAFLKNTLRDWVVYNPFLYRTVFREIIRRVYPCKGAIVARNARNEVKNIFRKYNVDLLIMHCVGVMDSAVIIEEAKKVKIPYIVINHFSNDHFNHLSIREQIAESAGIAGVSSIGVPSRLRDEFCNLSDGIDTEYYRVKLARPITIALGAPVILLPARIIDTKGQNDLIRACGELRNKGLRTKVVLAGRTGSLQYVRELKDLANITGLRDDVLFVGQLNSEELRDWYGVSSVLGFPTYHDEGLPRILMEAQAMKVPPVAYDVGGMSEGILHEKTGFLVRKGDIKTFTERLGYLLTNERERRKMGEAGRTLVEKRFSLEALADRHKKYYLQVLRKTHR